jgi:prephenate dehydratase
MIASMSKVAIQGVRGSFHDEAAEILVPSSDRLECVTFQDVFDAVINDEVEYGVVAIENSIHGSISHVYRLLDRNDLWVAGETTLDIEQYLIGPKKVEVSELNNVEAEVRTMFPAFAQCELWLEEYLPLAKRVELYDTAFSVQSVVDEGEEQYVAIAGKHAAKVYGGELIAGPINDHKYNQTRFILLTKEKQPIEEADRTMVIMTSAHQKGSLYEMLGVFVKEDINLSKLASHPIPGDKRHYAFYVDLDAGLETEAVQNALSDVSQLGSKVKVLGSYKV